MVPGIQGLLGFIKKKKKCDRCKIMNIKKHPYKILRFGNCLGFATVI